MMVTGRLPCAVCAVGAAPPAVVAASSLATASAASRLLTAVGTDSPQTGIKAEPPRRKRRHARRSGAGRVFLPDPGEDPGVGDSAPSYGVLPRSGDRHRRVR